jgi:Na+-transporting NADH:ubiquinone oxidoreductase subunit B
MKFLRDFLDAQHKHFTHGGKLEKMYPLYEALDTFAYTPGQVAEGTVHVRDALDLKRLMITVVIALTPAILMALFNTGYQANLALEGMGVSTVAGWRGDIYHALGFGVDSSNMIGNFVHGALYFFPIFIVTQMAGGFWEVLFATVRKHEVNEGFLVTGMLFPLTLPASIPLWQVAVGVSFGVVVGKEIFGGTGKNFLNIALLSRAYLYFAYPAQISGDLVWVAADGYSGATALGAAAAGGMTALVEGFTFNNALWGFIPGSMGRPRRLPVFLVPFI